MSVEWSHDLRSIVKQAKLEANRYNITPNTAILLKSLLDAPGPSGQILRSIGLSDQALQYALSHYRFRGEPGDAIQRLLDRAARLTSCIREDEVRPDQLLMAILDEPCIAQALLQALNLDLDLARQLAFSGTENHVSMRQTAVQSQSYSHARSVQAPAVARRSPTIIPVTSFSPSGEPTLDFIPVTPSVGTRVCPDTPPKSKPKIEVQPAPTASNGVAPAQQTPAARKTSATQAPLKRPLSARESQQATAVDLAKRMRLRQSQEQKALSAPQKSAPKPKSGIQNLSSLESKDSKLETNAKPAPKRRAGGTIHNNSTHRSNNSTHRSSSELRAASRAGAHEKRRIVVPGFNPFALSPSRFPTLCRFGRNLLAEAKAGKLDPVIEREHEIEQLIDILRKRRSNNPILIGEPGVGKTAIIEGLALNMAKNKAPRGFEQHTIIALDFNSFMCSTQLRGAVQERLNAIKSEFRLAQGQIILFLDEIHSWLGGANSEAAADVAADLKLAMSRGELVCIGATTSQEFRRAVDSDPAFERRFDVIEVKPPDVKTSIRIINDGIIEQYELHHDLKYCKEAITSAVKLSERFIKERALPDKALSVLDRAGSIAHREGKSEVSCTEVAKVIAQLAEIPLEKLLMTENEKLLKMEELMGAKLIGHAENIERISRVVRRNHAGFGAHRPIGSFLFLGPTGVGKTEAAKVLADFLFGSKSSIIRFDMSEYMEQHSVAKLIGAPAGYVGFDDGGLLTEALRKYPYQIVLFDEIEKAHPDVANILLQILDEGRLSDAKGRSVDFSNTVVVLTSNLGVSALAKAAQKSIGFGAKEQKLKPEQAEEIILKSARSHFSPELWNRIEEKLVFHPLSIDEIKEIAKLLLKDSADSLYYEKKIRLHFAPELIDFLLENGGYAPAYGARPMRRTIQSLVESRIAEWILSHDTLAQELRIGVENAKVIVTEIVHSAPALASVD
ncbi:MAG: AAA family ATPase [Bradymonadales bacterium]